MIFFFLVRRTYCSTLAWHYKGREAHLRSTFHHLAASVKAHSIQPQSSGLESWNHQGRKGPPRSSSPTFDQTNTTLSTKPWQWVISWTPSGTDTAHLPGQCVSKLNHSLRETILPELDRSLLISLAILYPIRVFPHKLKADEDVKVASEVILLKSKVWWNSWSEALNCGKKHAMKSSGMFALGVWFTAMTKTH